MVSENDVSVLSAWFLLSNVTESAALGRLLELSYCLCTNMRTTITISCYSLQPK